MKKIMNNIYYYVVGPVWGYSGEGNVEWYYFASLVINLMLIWRFGSEVLTVFMALAIAHFLIVTIYGYCNETFSLINQSKIISYIYIAIQLIIIYIALYTSIKWTIITMIITIAAYYLAPDITAEFISFPSSHNASFESISKRNITFFIILVLSILLAPTNLFIKLLIIVGMIMLHRVMDYLESMLFCINEVTEDTICELGLWEYYWRLKNILQR